MASKEKKNSKIAKKTNDTFFNSFSLDKIIPTKFQTLLFLLLILLIFLLFYSPLYFGGKTLQSGDIITAQSNNAYVHNHQGGFTLWNPYIFCGMPAYVLSVGYKWFNIVYVITNFVRNVFSSLFTNDYAMWTFYLLALSYTTFFFVLNLTRNKLISLFSALSSAYSTGIVMLLFIGHVTKLTAIFVFPVIILLLLNFQKKIKFLDVMLLLFFMPVMFLGWHVQIIFYIFLAVMIYFIYYLVRAKKIKDNVLFKQLLKSAGIFLIAVLVGLGIQSDNLTQVWEYTPYSTRGTESIIDKASLNTEKAQTEFYDYATNWSFSPGEMLTWIVPSYYGFGNVVYNGSLSQNKDVEVNTYFGQMPFVDVAQYMGVIVFLLAVFSIVINWKDPFVRYLTILIIISILISFGRTFPVVYDLMFHYFPLFDKFRIPSMILVLVQLNIPILAGLGLAKIVSLKKENEKGYNNIVRNIFLTFGGIFVLSLLLSSPIKSWFVSRVVESGQKGSQLQALHDFMADMFLSDIRFAFFLAAITFGLIYAYLKSVLSKDLIIILILVFSLIDLIRIDKRGETYTNATDLERLFQKPEYISVIQSFKDSTPFRILNLKQDGSLGSLNRNSNFNAYFLVQDLYGYSAVKPRGFQDYMDGLKNPGESEGRSITNQTLWRMANVKYIILDNPVNIAGLNPVYSGNKTYIYENKNALPRAYFVDTVKKADAIEILNLVKNNQFDPKAIAFVDEEIGKIDKPDSTASVQIEKYEGETIDLNVNASGNNFLFLGDTYVGKGWKAYIDGKETKIYRTNHNFRGIVIPKGIHKVKFEYLPESFVISRDVSLVLSFLVTLGLLVSIVFSFTKKKKQ